jgi:hypothetical protein
MRKGTIKMKGCKFLLCVFQFIGISRHNGILDNRGIIKLSSKHEKEKPHCELDQQFNTLMKYTTNMNRVNVDYRGLTKGTSDFLM